MTILKTTSWRRGPLLGLGAALVLAAGAAQARDCPELNLPPAQQAAFCDEFRALLYAPYDPKGSRNAPGHPKRDVQDILKQDPLWGEVYRSDPAKTLALIERIRNAGGLTLD